MTHIRQENRRTRRQRRAAERAEERSLLAGVELLQIARENREDYQRAHRLTR